MVTSASLSGNWYVPAYLARLSGATLKPPSKCPLSRSFSHTSSNISVSAVYVFSMRSVNGLVKVFGSSKVTSNCKCPKSGRRKRSVSRRDSVCGFPPTSSQPCSLKPEELTTRVSPSQCPTEYPSQVGFGSLG